MMMGGMMSGGSMGGMMGRMDMMNHCGAMMRAITPVAGPMTNGAPLDRLMRMAKASDRQLIAGSSVPVGLVPLNSVRA
jgi:hypothetical protein